MLEAFVSGFLQLFIWPTAKVIIVMGPKTPDHWLLKGVPAVETLAKTDDGRRLLQVAYAPGAVSKPFWFAPGVPKDRVAALRMAFSKALSDPAYLAEAKKAKLIPNPKGSEEVTKIVQDIINTPKATVRMLADIATAK